MQGPFKTGATVVLKRIQSKKHKKADKKKKLKWSKADGRRLQWSESTVAAGHKRVLGR